MQVILHIGFPKTGSSAIQSHIFTNQRWLGTQGVYVPKAGYASGLGHAFLLDQENWPTIADSGYRGPAGEGALAQLAEELELAETRGFQRALISWEGLALLNEPAITTLRHALGPHSVILLAYVREQTRLYQSSILQSVEHLTFFSTDSLFSDASETLKIPAYLHFDAVLSTWHQVFAGAIDIRTRLYHRASLLKSNVVLDFFGWLGLNPGEGFALDPTRVNPSLDVRSATLLVVAQASGLNFRGLLSLSRSLSRFVADCGTESSQFLSVEQENSLREQFREGNARFFETFRPENVDQDTRGFPVTHRSQAQKESAFTLSDMQHIHSALTNPAIDTWLGGPLVAKNVARVACRPNEGWRGAEMAGVWSVGPRSELAFRLPFTHPVHGPTAIRLTIGGRYYGRNVETLVTCNGRSRRLNLEQAELSVDIDQKTRQDGITLVMEHMFPEAPNDGAGASAQSGIAFRLEFLSYQFVWDPDDEQ
ncbi:MAG: hypothetical protein R3E54_14365 [Halioglobus sp.]